MAEDISENDLVQWQNLPADDFVKSLKRINDDFEEYHVFDHVDVDSRRRIQTIFRERFRESSTIRQEILRFLRILARDRQNLDPLLSSSMIQDVLGVGLLAEQSFEFDWESFIQAEMCLINILFSSNLARSEFNEIASNLLLNRIRLLCDTPRSSSKQRDIDDIPVIVQDIAFPVKLKIPKFPVEILNNEQMDLVAFYDLRIAFVASAQSKDLQLQWLKNGCGVFLKVLEQSLHFPEKLEQNSQWRNFTECTNWTLKILFNIFCYSWDDSVESNAKQCMLLCSKIVTLENIDPSLEQSAIDVIAVLPLSFEWLTPKLQCVEKKDTDLIHGGRDMTFANAVLCALKRRLEAENNERNELLGTFLTVLIRLSSQVKEARRYLRLLVIPPLHATDVERRPDDGAELRNRMVRLMMSISNTQDLAAEFIFILCKKSVNRFVKYCGFGHAAGLLANRGILNALNTPKHLSDSEASETEDYKAVETQVNPVTGCIEPMKENPFTEMTEEQKEYEVHRLMNDLSKLMNQGLITPGQIGKDGQLEPVKHVLELIKDGDAEPDKSDSEDGCCCMFKVSSNKERKLKKLKKNINEVLLLSGDDPTAVDLTSATFLGHSFDDKNVSLKLCEKLRTMRQLKDPPKINFSLNRLNGMKLGSQNIAELVHYVSFHNVEKPLWISLRPSRGILQAVIFRVGCDLEMVESNKKETYIDQFFGSKSFIRMQTEVWNGMEFWTSMLNVPLSKFERLKRIVNHAHILEKHIKSNMKGTLLVTMRQMVDFCYPFPKMNNVSLEILTPIVPTKEKYGTVKVDSPFFAVDCEMCTTEIGESELTRISIVNEYYEVLLDTLVKPRNRIVDYVTKYSGITEKMLENVNVRVEDVQKALSHILPNDAILVGHTLECDFKAMRITHPYCIDISLCLNLSGKDRQRSSLKTLARIFLDKEIQGENGHCSVDDAIITMQLLKYKLSHGVRFGNVSLGWSFDDWARENGLTTSGARINKSKNLSSEARIAEGPQRKRRCLDVKSVVRTCDKCGRPLSVACIVPYCACKKNVVKYCVICCLNSLPPQTSSEEPTLSWSDAFQACAGGSEPISQFLRLNKNKSAFYAIPDGIKDSANNEQEMYVNTNTYNSLDELVKRVSEEIISHNVVMVDIDAERLKMKIDGKSIVAVDNALRKMISYASWNSLIIVVFSSPQESLCYINVKTQNHRTVLTDAIIFFEGKIIGAVVVTVLFKSVLYLVLDNVTTIQGTANGSLLKKIADIKALYTGTGPGPSVTTTKLRQRHPNGLPMDIIIIIRMMFDGLPNLLIKYLEFVPAAAAVEHILDPFPSASIP